jgi:hypothetical protein
MATEAKVDLQQKTADANAWVITGAAMVGATDGVKKIVEDKADIAKKLIEPSDQHNIAHPLDDIASGAKSLASGISNTWQAATAPGDMNIDHSAARQPHPIDKTLQAHDAAIAATTDMLSEKGPVEGTRAASAVAAGVVVENVVNPSGKLKAVEAIADVAHDTKALVRADKVIHGEFISADETAKAVTIQPSATELAIPKPAITQTLLNSTPFKIFKDVFIPPDDTRIALEAYKRQPTVMDFIDAKHAGKGSQLADESNARMHQAGYLAEQLRANPNAIATDASKDTINGIIDHATLQQLNFTKQYATPVLPSDNSVTANITSTLTQERADALSRIAARENMSPSEKAIDWIKGKVTYPGGHRPSRDDRDALALADTDSETLSQLGQGVLKKIALQKVIVGAAVTGALYSYEDKDNSLSGNEKLANIFANTAGTAKLEAEHPELKSAYETYHQAVSAAHTRHPPNNNSAYDRANGTQNNADSLAVNEIYRARKLITEGIIQNGTAIKSDLPLTQQPEKHSSLQGDKLTPADLSIVLQQMASRNPDAALAYAQYLNNDQAQQTMQVKAPEAQV